VQQRDTPQKVSGFAKIESNPSLEEISESKGPIEKRECKILEFSEEPIRIVGFGEVYDIGILGQVLKGAERQISHARISIKKDTLYATLNFTKTRKILGTLEQLNLINSNEIMRKTRLAEFLPDDFKITANLGLEHKANSFLLQSVHNASQQFVAKVTPIQKIATKQLWSQAIHEKVINKIFATNPNFHTPLLQTTLLANMFLIYTPNPGPTLAKILSKISHFSSQEAITIIANIILITQQAHSRDIILRDLTPRSIIILPSGYPIINR
jgi:serine/threonine protein kinase